MARLIFNGAHREVLWTLTSGERPRTLPADNLDDPAMHLRQWGWSRWSTADCGQHRPATTSGN